MKLVLNEAEMIALFRQEAATKGRGGFQGLLVGLQENCNRETGEIDVSATHLERIPKYAFKYNNGGWEDRLVATFRRHLGPKLDRASSS